MATYYFLNTNEKEVFEKIQTLLKDRGLSTEKPKIRNYDSEKLDFVNVLESIGNRLLADDLICIWSVTSCFKKPNEFYAAIEFILKNKMKLFVTEDEMLIDGETNNLNLLLYVKNTSYRIVGKTLSKSLAEKKANGHRVGRPCGTKNKTKKLEEDRGLVLKMVENEEKISDIAQKLGCSGGTVRNWLSKNNISREIVYDFSSFGLCAVSKRKSKLDIYSDVILKQLQSGMDAYTVAKSIKCSHQILSNWLKKRGVKMTRKYVRLSEG